VRWLLLSVVACWAGCNDFGALTRCFSGACDGGDTRSGQLVTYRPTVIPTSDPEIPNPFHGEYAWFKEPIDPPGWPCLDSYHRFTWKELESAQGKYNFAAIDQELAAAQTRGGRFGLAVMPAQPNLGSILPDDLTQSCNGFWSGNTFIPDWNHTSYLDRWAALNKALGARYANDKRLGWVDIRGYGMFGEWQMGTISYPGPNGQQWLTVESGKRIVDAVVTAFPNQRLVALPHPHAPVPQVLQYALGLSPRIGLRDDCLGLDKDGAWWGMNAAQALGPLDPFQRWKTAPYITEFCGSATSFAQAATQVRDLHVASLSGGGSFPKGGALSTYPAAEQAAFIDAAKSASYRFVLESISLPGSLARGESFTVTSAWSNVNVSPAYDAWNVMIQLRNHSGSVIWQGRCGIDLEELLPTSGVPVSVKDGFTLDGAVAPGVYTLSIIVVDPQGYLGPLRLAIAGRSSDGSYALGSISVTN
jgi:hypothetical protein